MSKSVSFLYKLARLANDVEKLSSGDPKRIVKRAKNKVIGRKLIRKAWKFPFQKGGKIEIFELFYGHCWHR